MAVSARAHLRSRRARPAMVARSDRHMTACIGRCAITTQLPSIRLRSGTSSRSHTIPLARQQFCAKVLKLMSQRRLPWRSKTRTCLTNFLAKLGAGKQVLEFHKNQHVFERGDVADSVFYIQKRHGQAYCPSSRQGSSRRDFRARPVLRRRLQERSRASHRNHDGDKTWQLRKPR